PRVSNSLSALASEESIARESAALSRLSHPNIPALVEHGVAGGFRFVVLEYIRGADLHTHLDKGEPIPWPMALHISSQVCDALKAAHDGGIAHGDIKPENILISSERSPAVFLLDFGLARSLNSTDDMRGDTDIVLGTLDYMAPEALERGIITPLSDMYSLGVLMYEMLAGWNPFYGKDEWETIDRVLALDPSPPGAWLSLPSALDSVVMRAISKDPAKRFQSAAELKAAILSVSSRDTWL
ncbi:MAG: serine/threonine-protein kinase, partial [Candidatus Micrarchaeota archaeon]